MILFINLLSNKYTYMYMNLYELFVPLYTRKQYDRNDELMIL